MTGTNKMNQTKQNENTNSERMQREQGQTGNVRHDETGGRQREQDGLDKDREKSAIGGGQSDSQSGTDRSPSGTERSSSEPTNR